MKIAHISDIHIDTPSRPGSIWEFDRLIKLILEHNYDHIVITGDVVDVANTDDLRKVREVLRQNGILNWEQTTIIPGNHDIFGKYDTKGNKALSVIATAMQQRVALAAAQKLHAFCDIFRETITEDAELAGYFPFVKVLGGGKAGIAIVSFNSVLEWSLRLNPTGARGYVHASERQAIEQPEVLEVLQGKFVVALCHHAYKIYEPQTPVDTAFVWAMELLEKDAYLATLKKMNTKIALHGHFHRAEEYDVQGVHFINSGSVRRATAIINSIEIFPDDTYTNAFVQL